MMTVIRKRPAFVPIWHISTLVVTPDALITREPGGAIPGRGGRRKRARAATEWREINAWDHFEALEKLRRSSMRRNMRREVPLKELGYRERRRRAKLRRRRARNEDRSAAICNLEQQRQRSEDLAYFNPDPLRFWS